jgi:glucosamine kinase
MTAIESSTEIVYVGIDGGGSKCKARVHGPGVEGTGIAGPANPFQDLQQARASIVEATCLALDAAGLDETALPRLVAGVGLAGVNVPRFFDLMAHWQHPFAELHLTTDIHIACLSAHGGEDGAVIVAGTGSVGYSCIDGVTTSYGGHGFPLGDKGSGAWLGLEAVRAALLTLDGLGPDTTLLSAIESKLGATGLDVIDVLSHAGSRDFGALAPLVLAAAEQGDAVATGIVREGASYLDDMAAAMLANGARSVCLLGGLAGKIRRWMRSDLMQYLAEPLQEADHGALLYAQRCHAAATH